MKTAGLIARIQMIAAACTLIVVAAMLAFDVGGLRSALLSLCVPVPAALSSQTADDLLTMLTADMNDTASQIVGALTKAVAQ